MITTIISYCNNDFRFIEENLIQSKKFSDEIFISYCNKTFDDELEEELTTNKMLEIAKMYGAKPILCEYQEHENAKFHHNLLRYLPTQFSKNDYILYLDADEIIEGELFKQYLDTNEYIGYDIISLECYWYFREKNFRAKTTECAGVMCRKSICDRNYIFSPAERWEFFYRPQLKVKHGIKYNDQILCHHYSWVRTKEEMIKKVKTWAHKTDKNWLECIEKEFEKEFDGTDFVHNYQYDVL